MNLIGDREQNLNDFYWRCVSDWCVSVTGPLLYLWQSVFAPDVILEQLCNSISGYITVGRDGHHCLGEPVHYHHDHVITI
jgi:hypothetical protein